MNLAGQFDIGAWPRHHEGWLHRRLGELYVSHCPTLPVVSVQADGAETALVLGTAVLEGQMLADVTAPPADLESLLGRLGGSYAVLGADGTLHLDPCGSLSVVFDPIAGRAGSTPAAILPEDELDERLELSFHARIDRAMHGDGWLPAGLTFVRGVRRLLPNHTLSLTTWEVTRRWLPPRPEGDEAVERHVARVVETLTAQLQALTADGAYLTLTAGQDSRMLLACARGLLDRIWFFTFVSVDTVTVDQRAAAALRRRLDLPALELFTRSASAQDRAAWQRRSGYAVGGAIMDIHPTLSALDPRRRVLPGMAGEVARAYFPLPQPRTATGVLTAMHLPPDSTLVAAVDAWMEPLGRLEDRQLMDLAYIEHRLGCWASPQNSANAVFGATVIALSHPTIFDAMLRLPVEFREQHELAPAVCRRGWPEVLEVPFNRFAGLDRRRRLTELARGAAARLRSRRSVGP